MRVRGFGWATNRSWMLVALVAGLYLGGGACKESKGPKAGGIDASTLRPRSVSLARQSVLQREARPDADAKGERRDRCEEICELGRRAGCSNAKGCLENCRSMLTWPICRDEMAHFFDCLLRQPAKHWECDPDDIGAIRDPYCSEEQRGLVVCSEDRLGSEGQAGRSRR